MNDRPECPHCGNKTGFAFGTCCQCGFNYLDQMTDEQRREVYRILRVRVQMTGEVVADERRVAQPEGLSVSGVLDPRLWGDESQGGGSEGGNGRGGPRPPRGC